MAHWSENARRLSVEVYRFRQWQSLEQVPVREPAVYLLWLDPLTVINQQIIRHVHSFCASLPLQSTVCIYASPQQAAELLPHLENVLHYQHWIAVKKPLEATLLGLPNQHHALLILTRYRGTLQHTKTRIRYSYCPSCSRTTKDYGGKKHIYHEYGTLMSDIWRDIECNPRVNIDPIIERLSDLFGIELYETLHVIDMHLCTSSIPQVKESALSLEYDIVNIPESDQLINADCIDALKKIPTNSIDFCFADPPYNLKKRYDHWNDTLELQEYFNWCDTWLYELARVLKPGRTLAIINIPLWAVRHYQFLSCQLNFTAWIAWDALSFPVRLIMPAHYAILCFSKGESRKVRFPQRGMPSIEQEVLMPLAEDYCTRSDCIERRRLLGVNDKAPLSDLWHDIHRLKHNSRRADHPCQLPPKLMQRLISLFTEPEETVLDPFNGVGTTTLVAQQLGRRYIGIEISSEYHQIALERHKILATGGNPFAKRDAVPNAKNSPVDRLPKQRYVVPKKTLQLEVKRIAQTLGRIPTREEVARLGRYPIEFYDRYFISWGEVCAAARTTGMSEYLPHDTPSSQATLFEE
ncbi:MAG: DNA methyltransferase [Fimbriimonadales bacterium]